MAAADVTNSDLRFKNAFTLYAGSEKIKVTDKLGELGLYNSLFSVVEANVRGLLKVVDPTGATIYQNTGWATDDFSSADIEQSGSWEKEVSLVLDSDGDVILGEYTIHYKVDLNNDGANIVESSAVCDLTDYTKPTAEISISSSCRLSTLTSKDVTSYSFSINGTSYSSSSITRSHSIYKPNPTGCSIPSSVTTTDKERTIGGGGAADTDIWTGLWSASVTGTYTGVVSQWDALSGNTIDKFEVTDKVTANDTHEVECESCLCDILTCISNMIDRWESKIGESVQEADNLMKKVVKLLGYIQEYTLKERCGEDTDSVCAEIVSILQSEDCDCTASSDESTHVVPWGGTSSASTSTFSFTTGSGDPSSGNAGDLYINTDDWTLWKNVAGTWISQGSFEGGSGSSTDVWNVKYSDISDTATTGDTEEDLKSYTLPADTLDTNGDKIVVEAVFELGTNTREKTVKMYFGGDEIASYFTNVYLTSDTNKVKIRATIHRISASSQIADVEIYHYGSPSNVIAPKISSLSKALGSTQVVKITGDNEASASGDVTAKLFTVDVFKKE